MSYSENIYRNNVTTLLQNISDQLTLQNQIIVLNKEVKLGIISQAEYREKIEKLGVKI